MKGQKDQGGYSLEGEVEEVGRGLVTGQAVFILLYQQCEALENFKLEKRVLAAL